MESSIATPDYVKLVLTITTDDYVEMLNAIVEAKCFNENLKKSCEDSLKKSCESSLKANAITTEIKEKCERRLETLDTLLKTVNKKYLEYFASIY